VEQTRHRARTNPRSVTHPPGLSLTRAQDIFKGMAAVLLLFTPSAFALAPRHPMTPGHPVTPCRGAFSCRLCDSSAANGGFSTADFGAELKRRGLQTALDALEEDGPSAFKSPTKVIEYVMLCLQHRGDTDGIAEAFRFTCREAGKSSFVSGLPLSSKRVAWRTAKVVSGYASGRSLPLEDFEAEVREHYALLLGCAQWRWAVTHPATQEPLARE